MVGIAGFLSTHAAVPWIYSPFALLTMGPALLLSDAVGSAGAMLLLINSKTPRFEISLAFQGTLFAWLAWCAFPWLGPLL